MAIPKFKPLANASEGTKKLVRPILGVLIALLLGAFGLQATNTDFDLGKLMSGSTLQEAKIETTKEGNMLIGDYCKKNKYNCSDFKFQEDAQLAFEECGGKGNDVNGLDRNKNGKACESNKSKKTGSTGTE